MSYPKTKNGAEFTGLRGTIPLVDALYVSGPFKVEDAPNAYSFERSNLVNIDWGNVLKTAGISAPETNSAQLKRYIEQAWGKIGVGIPEVRLIRENTFDLNVEWPAYIHDSTTLINSKTTPNNRLTIFTESLKVYRKVPFAEAHIAIQKGCVIRVKTQSNYRWYQPIIEDQDGVNYPLLEEFAANWDLTWEGVTALVQVYYPGPAPDTQQEKDAASSEAIKNAKMHFSAIEVIRADAATISKQYKSLMHDEGLEKKLSDKADEIANLIPSAPYDAIPSLTAQFRELKSFGIDLDSKKRQLADAAADLNYHLFITDTPVTYYNESGVETTDTLKEGALYLKSNKTVSWNTYQTVTTTQRSLFRKQTASWQVAINNSKTFDYYERAIVDYDPWVELLDFYKVNGYNTYLFRFTDRGLEAADGSTPDDILNLCENNEEFRTSCVIALPKKETTLIGQTFIIGYNVFIRPVPDIIVTSFPDISIKERLSYRFTWNGVALGDLAATIPLCPGEEREVTLSTSQKYEASRSETASSLIDITRIDRADFETLFEKEVRNENESTTSAGASAGGSYGGFSGSANFSKTKSTKEVARQLNRSVHRASQEVNRRTKEEKSVTISEKSETTLQNTTTFRVRNINDGSTLNIAFYRLYNAFQSLLKLDDFRFVARAGRSIFAAIDLVDEVVFGRDNFDELVSWLQKPGRFPFDISSITTDERLRLKAALDLEILEAYKQYPDPPADKEGEAMLGSEKSKTPDSTITEKREVLLLKLKGKLGDIITESQNSHLSENTTEDLSSRMELLMIEKQNLEEGIIGLPFWMETTDFATDSGGLYADVYVGQRPATEPYAENMRRLEERRVAGENRLLSSRARYLDSKSARQLIGIGAAIDSTKVYVTDADVLYLSDGHVEVKLRLVPGSLFNSGWAIVLKTSSGFTGGRFLQDGSENEGVLVFILPRRFNDSDQKLGQKDVNWFKANVSAENSDLSLKIGYRETN